MRITNKMISKSLLSTISGNRSLAAEISKDIATTKRIRKPSDDPGGVVQVERYKGLISQNEQFTKNLTHIRGFNNNSQSALDRATEDLETARNLAIQGASETTSPEAKQALAQNIDQIIDNLVDLGNSKYKGKFVFGGTLTTQTAPFSRSGDVVTYNGNSKSIRGQVGFDTQVAYNKTGQEIFNPGGDPDIFAELVALKQGLESNDGAAIQATVGTLESAQAAVLAKTAEIGALQNRLDSTEILINNENIDLADQLSRIEDTDLFKAIVDAKALDDAITGGLQTMANAVQRTLLDFVS